MSIRNQRMAEQIRAELARLLREETADPRIGLVTLNRVKLAPDLSTAFVFWSPLDVAGETDAAEVQAGLDSAAGFLRRRIGAELRLRRTPEILFRFDPSIDEGSRVLALLRSLPHAADDARDPGQAAPSSPEGAAPDVEEA